MSSAPLDEDTLRRRLVEDGPYARLVRVESIGSTNAFLSGELGEPGAGRAWPHLSVLTAEEQTGGSGRLGRAWSSPRCSSLSSSVVLRPDLPVEDLVWVSLLAGVALAEVLREDHGITAHLKWPNDVHVEGRKISGILSVLGGGGPAAGGALILGCGINVLLDEDELPTPTSTSVLLEKRRLMKLRPAERQGRRRAEDHPEAPVLPEEEGLDSLRTDLLASFLGRFADILAAAEESGSVAPLLPRITAVMDTIGQEVRVELPDGGAKRGVAVGLEPDGSLIVEVTDRRRGAEQLWEEAPEGRQSFSAGDVVHLRRR